MHRTEISAGSIRVAGLTSLNVLIGRNGTGKSRLLRALDTALSGDATVNVRYISPERAGVFQRDGGVMTNMVRDPEWLKNVRRRNQATQFKAASANLLRELETAYLRKLQDTPSIRCDLAKNFRTERLDKVNRLLANLTIIEDGADFVFRNSSESNVPPDDISSGESEAVALATEIMYFLDNVQKDKFNVLLLDEPDVHLHPDLQARLARLLITMVDELSPDIRPGVTVLVATHSTPFICAISTSDHASIGTKDFDVDDVKFSPFSQQIKKVAPFFGHPLSLSLSNDVMLILEGEDDERVWQQATRSAKGGIKLFPVLAKSVDQQSELERFCATLLESLYDDPIAYSIRDGDGKDGDLEPVGPVRRFRLKCYAIENVLLTDDSLSVLGTTWEKFQLSATKWIADNEGHKDLELVQRLVNSEDRLRHRKIKSVRQLICAIAGTTKPWEVVVGQAIGLIDPRNLRSGPYDLATFLGVGAIRTLLGTPSA